ncbi:MAG: ABC transporter substrate-binding protein [Candidatus Geothermincolia bacterium]
MKKTLVLSLALILLVAAFATAGCGPQGLTIEKGKLRMYGNENVGFLEINAGKPTGFSAELAQAIAGKVGLKLEVALLPFSDLFSRLTADICDIAMSAITITPERKLDMDFSEPYFSSGQSLLVRTGSTIAGESDLKGKNVGVIKGTTNQKLAEKVPGVGQVMVFDGKPEMFDALIDGKLDAVIVDTPFAQYNVKSTGKTSIAKVLTTGEQYGIAVKKGNSRLLEKINAAMDAIRKDGTYDRLYKKYFGEKI